MIQLLQLNIVIYDYRLGYYAADRASFYGKIGDLNLWGRTLSVEEMKNWTQCYSRAPQGGTELLKYSKKLYVINQINIFKVKKSEGKVNYLEKLKK